MCYVMLAYHTWEDHAKVSALPVFFISIYPYSIFLLHFKVINLLIALYTISVPLIRILSTSPTHLFDRPPQVYRTEPLKRILKHPHYLRHTMQFKKISYCVVSSVIIYTILSLAFIHSSNFYIE